MPPILETDRTEPRARRDGYAKPSGSAGDGRSCRFRSRMQGNASHGALRRHGNAMK